MASKRKKWSVLEAPTGISTVTTLPFPPACHRPPLFGKANPVAFLDPNYAPLKQVLSTFLAKGHPFFCLGSPLSLLLRSLGCVPLSASAVSSYACLSFSAIALEAVLVLYLFEPIKLGGLGFNTEHTGLLLSLTGLGGVAVQLVLFPPLQRRLGLLRLYQLSMWAFPVSIVLLPLANAIARLGLASSRASLVGLHLLAEEDGGRGKSDDLAPAYLVMVWSAVVLSSLIKVMGGMAFSSNMILVNQCSWLAKGTALGTLNSLAQMAASITRAIGPYAASTLFAVSVTQNLLGGQMVWLVLFGAGLLGSLSSLLIRDLEKERNEEALSQTLQR